MAGTNIYPGYIGNPAYAFGVAGGDGDINVGSIDEVGLVNKIWRPPLTVKVTKSDADLTCAFQVSGTFVDVDATGTAAARNLDIVLPNMQVGDYFDITPNFYAFGSNNAFFDFAVYKAGVRQRRLGGGASGISAYGAASSSEDAVQGTTINQVIAGDLESDNSLRLRLQHGCVTANRTILILTGGNIFTLVGRGPF